jgi:hypothetical protein
LDPDPFVRGTEIITDPQHWCRLLFKPRTTTKIDYKSTWLAISRAGMMDWMEDIFFSEKRTKASLYSTFAPLLVFTKKGEMYPRSNFMPEKRGSNEEVEFRTILNMFNNGNHEKVVLQFFQTNV